MSFQEILEFLNFLYALGMLLEFAAFIKLRIKKPDLSRPYRVPLQTFGATMLCVPPAILLLLVMCLASFKTYLVSGAVVIIGMFLYPALNHVKDRKWIEFSTVQPAHPVNDDIEEHSTVLESHQVVKDEASVSLLSALPSSNTEEASEISPEGVQKLD